MHQTQVRIDLFPQVGQVGAPVVVRELRDQDCKGFLPRAGMHGETHDLGFDQWVFTDARIVLLQFTEQLIDVTCV